MAERVQTPITGITTTNQYEEGSTYSLVNLRPKNGVLKPVPPRKVIQELSQSYDVIFVHQSGNYKNWLGVKHVGDNQSKLYDNVRETPSLINVFPRINSMQQIGNTISLITDEGIFYILYTEDEYKVLGQIPEMEPIKHFSLGGGYPIGFYEEYSSVTKDYFETSTIGLMNLARKKAYEAEKGCFSDAHLMMFAYRLYDGTLIKHSAPVLITNRFYMDSGIGYKFNGDNLYIGNAQDQEHAFINLEYYKLYLDFDINYLDDWSDIIKSIDIFVSSGIGYASESNMESLRTDLYNFSYKDLFKDQSKMIESIKRATNFYLIDSIELGGKSVIDLTKVSDPSFKKGVFSIPDGNKLEEFSNLYQQETLTVDTLSHHLLTADVSYAYNSRLHIAGISNVLFDGFKFDRFNLIEQAYDDGSSNSYYNGSHFSDYMQYKYANGILIAVDVKINSKTHTVYSRIDESVYFWMNSLFSYPDSRAIAARFYEIIDENTFRLIHEIELVPSSSHNFAYHIHTNEDETIAVSPAPNKSDQPVITLDTSTIESYRDSNKIKVSELNNPFVFPNENSYIAGNGRVIAMAANTMNIADRNFGQWPLYIFTTHGIWALNVGNGDTVYSTLTAPVYTETPTTGIVCETPFGVVFTTHRGLMIINGNSTNFISPQIEYSPKILNIEMNSHCDNVVFSPEERKLSDILKEVSNLIFNPYENELVISSKGSDMNYVLNLSNNQFHQSTEKIDLVVDNNLPDLFVMEGNKMKDYAFAEKDSAHVSFILRPLKFGMLDIKRFERMVLRGLLYSVKNPMEDKFSLFMVHYSMDGINFKALTGYPIKEGNFRDIDSRLMSRSKFSHCLFILAGEISMDSGIEYLETEFYKEYNNTKMR